MATQTEEEAKARISGRNPFDEVYGRGSATSGLDWAVFGCLAAGAVGIIKALGMDSPSGVLLCLLGSVAAFGLVIFFHFKKP
jgi:hypothetical protein